MDTKKGDNNTGGVISYVGPCGGTPSRTCPISMCSKNSNSLSCFSSSSTHTPPFRSCSSSSSGSAGEDGSSSAGGSPQGSDGGSFRALTSKSVASLTKLGGMMLRCKVCGDGASGFHYGVHACEGCKGFFRRSIQQNIQYKKCVQNESCSILRVNRNRCQQCRFKKCLSVGMSRDAVRFGRIPKREKQRMLAEMQSAMNNMNTSLSSTSSTCPRVTITPYPQPSALPFTPSAPSHPASPPTLPLPPFPYQSPSPSSPLTPSPELDSTISAIARAHRETFLYAHDKLANPQVSPQQNNHAHQNMGAEPWAPNRCPSGYHSNGQNTIYHYNNNLLLDNRRNKTQNHYGNGRRNLDSSNLIMGDDHVTQGQNCAMKKHRGIMLACPMNMQPHTDASKSPQETWEDFCLSFTPAVREVVEFAKQIPGFRNLSPDDQVTLLKAGTFEVLMVRFASLFHLSDHTVTFISGATYSLEELRAMGMSDLLGAMFDFSHKLASLELSAQERSLFTAVVLVSAGRCGIQNVASVEQLQENLIRALRSLVSNNHQGDVDSPRFTKLLLKLADLRTLNNLHSDKLLAFRIHA